MNGLGLHVGKSGYIDYTPVASDSNWWTGDGVNDYIQGDAGAPFIWSDLSSQDLSISMWVRIDSSSNKAQKLISFAETAGDNTNFISLSYLSSNKNLRYRIKTTGGTREGLVHISNSNNAIYTGLNNDGWVLSNRGATNPDGFCLITLTVDISASGMNAFKWYWNGNPLTAGVSSSGSSISTFEPAALGLGDNIHESAPTAGALGGALNEVKLYNRVLSSSEVVSIYNSGGAASASAVGVTSGLITEWRLNDDVTDSAGEYSSTNNGGVLN